MGEPQHQIAAAMDSANGEKHSSALAVAEKTRSKEQKLFKSTLHISARCIESVW